MGSAPLTFDAALHRYLVAGREIPSVTRVLAENGLGPPEWLEPVLLRGAADIGTLVHNATLLIDEGDLDWRTVHPHLLPYLRAYEAFRQRTEFLVDAAEERVLIADGRCAGTLDRRGRFPGNAIQEAIVDIKTGVALPAHALQLAAYALPFSNHHRRFGLYLKRDGTYRLKEYADPEDARVFLAMLDVATWKRTRRV